MNKKYEIKNGWLIINTLDNQNNKYYQSCKLSSISFMYGYKVFQKGFSIKLIFSGLDTKTEILYTEDEKDLFLSDIDYLQKILMSFSNNDFLST